MKQHNKDYFEGILQIRNETPGLLSWIHARIKNEGRARVAKEKKVKNGVDLYISDQHYLQNLGRQLKQKFTGILKTSKRLHTVDKMTSKHIYRVTVLFKAIPFKKGDIVTLHGEKVEILRIGNKAQVKNIKSGTKKDIDLELLRG
ncbi:MAG: NMD3-related protein [Candidatus Woesearchaeota archaeon]